VAEPIKIKVLALNVEFSVSVLTFEISTVSHVIPAVVIVAGFPTVAICSIDPVVITVPDV
jgi:hypothetical protein